MDIPQLAQEVAKFLAPFLPYLIAGTKAAAEEAGKQFGKAAWEKAAELWKQIWGKAKKKEAAKEAIEDAAQHPTDEDAQAAFRRQLIKLLEADEKLLNFVVEHLNVTTINIGGNVEKATILVGNENKVINNYIQGNVYNGPVPRNPQDALKVYRAVMANSTASLSMRGIDLRAADPNTQRAIGLANVYIDLDTTVPLIEVEKVGGNDKVPRALIERDSKILSALDAVIKFQSLVIKGDPGSGKSTFVNYLTYCLSTQTTKQLEGWKKKDADLLPVIVILRDFVRAFKKLPEHAEPRHIWDFIEKRLKDQNLSPSAKPILELLEKGKVILFFDGLDEVSSIPQRIFVRDAVHAFVSRYPKNRYVVTCRILSYTEPKKGEPDLRLAGFPEFELAQFSPEKISSFIDAWYRELTTLGVVTSETAMDLNSSLKTAIQRPELRKLAPNPLLLTVMAVVNTHKGRLPDHRAPLYKDTVEILLWQWEQASKGQDAARLRQLMQEANCTDADMEQVICKLAFEAHAYVNLEDDEETLAGISEINLQKELAAINKNDLNWAAAVIETMKMRAGLLLERENNVFTLPHRSFQEFLAGTYLDSKDDFVQRAMQLADNQLLWRQVILWAVSRRVFIRGSVDGPLALVGELCPSNAPIDEKGWSRVWLAGDILLEIGLNRVERSELGKDLLLRLQNRLVELIQGSRLTSRERAEAGNTLARLGDPRPGVTTDYVFCEIPAGTFKMGNTEETDPTSYEDERPQFEYTIPNAYFMSRYPVTNAQFEEFIKDPQGYRNDAWWTKAGLEWRKDRKEHYRYGGVFALANHPVVGVTWYEANAYCNWLTNQYQVSSAKCQVYDPKTHSIAEDPNLKSSIVNRQSKIRLPSEAEWERAARGGHDFRYPWKSDEIMPDHANYGDTNLNTTSAVGAFPKGMNEYGLLDMSGNVWEWCATEWQENYSEYLKKENNEPEGTDLRVRRGGAFGDDGWLVRCAYRDGSVPLNVSHSLGFRVVVAAVVSHFS